MTDTINNLSDNEVISLIQVLCKKTNLSLDFDIIDDGIQIHNSEKIILLKSILIKVVSIEDSLGIPIRTAIDKQTALKSLGRERLNLLHKGIVDIITIDNLTLVCLLYHLIPNFKLHFEAIIKTKNFTKKLSLDIEKPKIPFSEVIKLIKSIKLE